VPHIIRCTDLESLLHKQVHCCSDCHNGYRGNHCDMREYKFEHPGIKEIRVCCITYYYLINMDKKDLKAMLDLIVQRKFIENARRKKPPLAGTLAGS